MTGSPRDASSMDLDALPKAELHLHIEGTLEPELVFELADRNRVRLPFADVDALRRAYDFSDLQSFLDLYYACMAVLQTEQDFHDLAAAYYARAAAQGVRHVEPFFDPQAHTARGVPIEAVVDGLDAAARAARADRDITGGLIACILRDQPVDDALRTLDALAGRADGILGLGLDSAEAGNPPALFAEVYERASASGWRLTAHAGEEGGPEYVREALDVLRVERIDHGVRSIEDDALVARLAADDVPLTVCPLSNLALGGVASIADHPLPRLLDAGLHVTVNSDDPAYFGGYVADNYRALVDAFGFDFAVCAQLARNSITAAWTDDARRTQLLAEVDAWAAGAGR
jgi:adenosine deaminase